MDNLTTSQHIRARLYKITSRYNTLRIQAHFSIDSYQLVPLEDIGKDRNEYFRLYIMGENKPRIVMFWSCSENYSTKLFVFKVEKDRKEYEDNYLESLLNTKHEFIQFTNHDYGKRWYCYYA